MHKPISMLAAVAMAFLATPGSAETPRETIVSSQQQEIPNIPGKSLAISVVEYLPGAKTLPHRHPDSNLVYARVLSGAIRSQVNDEPVTIYQTGESWFEQPGTHHKISENASDSQPARLLVAVIVETGSRTLLVPDPK